MRNPTRIAIFVSIISVFLYIANLVVYEALAVTFAITSPSGLLLLGISLGVLAASFVGLMILGSYFYNLFTRVAYTLVAVWIGTFAYLFFASVALGLVLVGNEYGALVLPAELIGKALFAAALLVSAYGVVHAKKINASQYTVSLPHIPQEWVGKRAVFISDLHLGQLHGPGFAAKVARFVNSLKADIIFIGGDLYDGTQAPDPKMLAEPLKNMQVPWGVHYITGNHEEFGDNTVFIKAIKALGINVLYDEKVDIHGLQLIGVDYHNAHTTEGFAEILKKCAIDPSKPSILLKHEPNHLHVADNAGVSLQISGHTHLGQQWPFGLIAQLNYLGYAYGLKQFGSMQMLTSSGIGTWGPPLRVGTKAEAVVITFI